MEISTFSCPCSRRTRGAYDRAASRYEYLRKIWLKLAGEGTERALLRSLPRALRQSARILDAGSGTGAPPRQIQRPEPVSLVSLYQSLPYYGKQEARSTAGSGGCSLPPFPDRTFDIVAGDWVQETIPDRRRGLEDYLRVMTPRGCLLYSLGSLPREKRWRSRSARLSGGPSRALPR